MHRMDPAQKDRSMVNRSVKDDAPEQPCSGHLALQQAILQTVAYVDMYDYPLTEAEIHRYLVGLRATRAEVNQALVGSRGLKEHIERSGNYYFLTGRDHIVDIRQEREHTSRELWPHAVAYGRLASALPYVQMVAVTGSLAVDNVDDQGDIDFLIVTEVGRLWLCRALIILLVRAAARRGIWLCPNYFLSRRALHFDDHNLFAAHEIAQMVPISGQEIYHQLLRENPWVVDYLPNAFPQTRLSVNSNRSLPLPIRWGRRTGELVLRTPIGGRLERWEMNRKVRRFGQLPANETAFSPDYCKGHFEDHGQRTLAEFSGRLQQLAIVPEDTISE